MVERCFLRNEFSLFILILATNVAFLIIIIREQNDEQLASFVSKKVVFPVFFQDVISTVPGRSFLGEHRRKGVALALRKKAAGTLRKNGVDFLQKVNAKFSSQGVGFFHTVPNRSVGMSDHYYKTLVCIYLWVHLR
jgi:hypothetical protein